MLALDLPLALRRFVPPSQGRGAYEGILPQAVRRFGSTLPEQERVFVKSCEQDFVDYLLDDVIVGVEKPLLLIELCLARPHSTINDLVANFAWEEGLKRDTIWKRSWVVNHLRSFVAAGIPLPESLVYTLGDEGESRFEYNEIAFAVAPLRLKQSWIDFKKNQDYARRFLSISEETNAAGTAEEGVDYGIITMAEVARQTYFDDDRELKVDLQLLGKKLSTELGALLDRFHAEKPRDGYPPIAWHHVFWNLISEYMRLRLDLAVRDPFHEKDQELADYIKEHYGEVRSISRPVILRRRNTLTKACEDLIKTRFLERFTVVTEQLGKRITHVD
ncbi:MAG: hypothetical protein KIT57_09045 [Blastocatellales bacterium]|nr:hypothetical protein [Blastocatellales bacterium]